MILIVGTTAPTALSGVEGTETIWVDGAKREVQVEAGWEINTQLNAGRYRYKYIIDSKWLPDPSHEYREDDGHGGYNSVVEIPGSQLNIPAATLFLEETRSDALIIGSDKSLKKVISSGFTQKGWCYYARR